MNTSEEQIILVNEQDQEIGQEEKLTVHQQALCHRAFSVFVVRKQKNQTEILLQKRNLDKYHSGNLWTNTCCGHPRPGENIVEAGRRRLKEEMGIDIALKEIGAFHYIAHVENNLTENEVDHVLLGIYNGEIISPDPSEVSEYRWIEMSALFKDLKYNAKQYTPWLQQALEILK